LEAKQSEANFKSIFSLNFHLFYLRFCFRFLVFRIKVNHVKSGFFRFQAKQNFLFNFKFRFRSESEGSPYTVAMPVIAAAAAVPLLARAPAASRLVAPPPS
jgi:hypothetical protein